MPLQRPAFDPKGEKAQGYQGKFGTTAPSYVADRFKTDVRMLPQFGPLEGKT
jgi:hypothetical protein